MSSHNSLDKFLQMLFEFEQAPETLKWDFSFPMGVFGTLRQGWGNDPLMGYREGEKPQPRSRPHTFVAHYKAFLTDFVAVGLRIRNEPGATAPFEIYVYEESQWEKMIPRVDSLEGFHPGSKYGGGYHRTLASLHLLPAEFTHPLFEGQDRTWERDRNLKIPMAQWTNYHSLPCWIYSSLSENNATIDSPRTPILWDGVRFDK